MLTKEMTVNDNIKSVVVRVDSNVMLYIKVTQAMEYMNQSCHAQIECPPVATLYMYPAIALHTTVPSLI